MNELFKDSEDERKPVFSWCPDVDDNTLKQIHEIWRLPFVEHCALMPDAHLGQNMPIGGVAACNKVVVPDFVGSDIGCGMCAVKTTATEDVFTEPVQEAVMRGLEMSIPVGFSHNPQQRRARLQSSLQSKVLYIAEKAFGARVLEHSPVADIVDAFFDQVGTLGGGNHFLEFQRDTEGYIWIMVHSGSRNIGNRVWKHFNDVAKDLNSMWFSAVPSQIPFLPTNSPAGREYLMWMQFALEFAFQNRSVLIESAKDTLSSVLNKVGFDKVINIHHNYASQERHFGRDLWVHRKGATLAQAGTVGIIPGSMGTPSYIVTGLGNKMSLNSCSHGAGRRYGRIDFNTRFNNEEGIESVKRSLDGVKYRPFGKHISRGGRETGMLDIAEAPSAYKDIDKVMANQTDLVSVAVKLFPVLSFKDTGKSDD